jgi:hypothetical protein
MSQPEKQKFDIFFAYNSADRDLSVEIADRLRSRYGLRVWLDAWRLPAGEPWRPGIVAAIGVCRTFAVMFGSSGWGMNQLEEVRQAIGYAEQTTGFRIIPILLPGADEAKIGQVETDEEFRLALLDLFSAKHRIDLRSVGIRNPDRLAAFAAGILGYAPGPPKMSLVTIEEDADEWNRTNRMDKTSLYRGHTLKRALELAEISDDTAEVVRSFLAAARAQEHLRSRILIGVVTAAVIIAGFAVYANLQRIEANRQRHIAEANATKARSASAEADYQRHVAEGKAKEAQAASAEANRLRGVAEAAQAKATKGRQALLTYLISDATSLPDPQARAWAAAPARPSSGTDVKLAVVEEWKSILSEVLLQPQVLRNIKSGQTILIYLSLPYDPDIGYINAGPLLNKSIPTRGFQTRLKFFAARGVSILTENGMSTDANFYSPESILRSASGDQFTNTLLQSLLFSEAETANGALNTGRFVAQWRESEDPSPEEFRRAFAQFRGAIDKNVATLKKTLKFWNVQSAPDPEASFHRIMSAAGRAMAGDSKFTPP